METSESTTAIFAAIAEFRKNRPSVVKAKQGARGKYAPLDAVMEAIDTPLADAGLFVAHPMQVVGDKTLLETRLIHLASGEWIGSTSPLLIEQNTNQGVGSAITYMRRYALLSLLGIAPDDDDDGDGARRGAAVTEVRKRRDDKPKPLSLRDQIEKSVNQETDPEKMGSYTARINQRADEGKLSPEDAKACRAAVAERTAALVSLKASGKGKLFDDTAKPEGVGV